MKWGKNKNTKKNTWLSNFMHTLIYAISWSFADDALYFEESTGMFSDGKLQNKIYIQ